MESDQIEFELESHAYCTEVTLNDLLFFYSLTKFWTIILSEDETVSNTVMSEGYDTAFKKKKNPFPLYKSPVIYHQK